MAVDLKVTPEYLGFGPAVYVGGEDVSRDGGRRKADSDHGILR